MPDSNTVLTALRNDLEAAALIRKPHVAGPLAPMFVEPPGGAPAPGEREGTEAGVDLTVTARLSGEMSEAPGNHYRRRVVVDVLYRSTGTAGLKRARELDADIRARLVEGNDYGFGRVLAGAVPVQVLQASTFGGLSPLSELGGVRTDIAKYALEVLAA